MIQPFQTRLVFHGAIFLLTGLLAGFPYALAISQKWSHSSVDAWRLAHSAGAAGGVAVLVVANLLPLLKLTEKGFATLTWSLMASLYGFMIGMPLAAITGYRGIEPVGPFMNYVVYFLYLVGAIGALIAISWLIFGAYRARKN